MVFAEKYIEEKEKEKNSMDIVGGAERKNIKPPRLFFSFMLHAYQPPLLLPGAKKLNFPWVRLHVVRDYADLIKTLRRYPEVCATIELTPSLIEQIEFYKSGGTDTALELTKVKATALSFDQKVLLLRDFFEVEGEMMRPFPRYLELKAKRGKEFNPESIDPRLSQIAASFIDQDYLDLQVLYNLAWIGPESRKNPEIAKLIAKERNYSEKDKEVVIGKHMEIMKGVLELYKEAQRAGQLEIPTAPYFHPILPLLVDSGVAEIVNPKERVPSYVYPEDAIEQVERAVRCYKDTFGEEPRGMWPSEGGVSMEVLGCVSRACPSLRWLATDQAILLKSMHLQTTGQDLDREWWKKFYPWQVGETGLSLFFRDTGLSHIFAFGDVRYPKDAAEDILMHLRKTAGHLPDGIAPPLVMLIGDAENMQGPRSNLALGFFETLYQGLTDLGRRQTISTITPSSYIEQFPPQQRLQSMLPGSWVEGSFARWIGNRRANRMWSLLADARRSLAEDTKAEDSVKAPAYDCLLRAQSSCFFWWLADVFGYSKGRELMDELQRSYIAHSYTARGKHAPPALLASTYLEC